jgi:hypothetical protein
MDPPLALLHQFISHFRQVKNHQFNLLYPVLKQALITKDLEESKDLV